jgi:hypothetical protein
MAFLADYSYKDIHTVYVYTQLRDINRVCNVTWLSFDLG